jgi:SnoaL-like domain
VELPHTGLEAWEPVPAETLERARARWVAARQGELEPMLEVWAADCEVHSVVGGVLEGASGVFRGHEGLREFWLELRAAFEDFGFEPRDIRRRGNLTLVIGQTTGRGRASGVEIAMPMIWLTQRDEHGQNVWAQAFRELEEALTAAAMREARD